MSNQSGEAKRKAAEKQKQAEDAAQKEKSAAPPTAPTANDNDSAVIVEGYNSGWDGSVTAVVSYLEKNLNDPKSLEFVSWSKVMKIKDGFAVRVKYRAKNPFGALILKDQMFYLDSSLKHWPTESGTGSEKVLSVRDY